MNSRKVKDIVAEINEFIDAIPKNDIGILKDSKSIPPMERIFSGSALDDFRAVLKEYATCEKEATAKTLAPIVEEITFYGSSCGTSYFYYPSTLANRVFTQSAKIIGEHLKLDYTSILLPNIKGLDGNHKLTEYIIRDQDSDDICKAMLLEDAFLELEKKFRNEPYALSIEEENLVAGHSVIATAYYEALQDGDDSAPKLKEQLHKALQSDDYAVLAEPSKCNAQKMGDVVGRKKSKAEFLSLLCRVPLESWPEVISYVSDANLYKFFLGVSNLEEEAERQARDKKTKTDANYALGEELRKRLDIFAKKKPIKLDSYEPKYVCALIYCCFEIYKRTRKLQPEFKSAAAKQASNFTSGLFGKALSYVMEPPCSEAEKEQACDFAMKFLSNKENQLLSFFETNEYKNHRAFKGGLLKVLVEFFKAVANHPSTLKAEGARDQRREDKQRRKFGT